MIYSIFFSPTDNGKKLNEYVRNYIWKELHDECKVIDITYKREDTYSFNKNDIIIFSSPTYAGRLPNLIMPYFRDNFQGNGAKIILFTTFGNRNYDSSLIELYTLMKNNGFHVVGAMSICVPHGFSKILGMNRPNDEDYNNIDTFLKGVVRNINDNKIIVVEGDIKPYYIPLKEDNTPGNFLKAKSQHNEEKCIRCGLCVRVCPVHSINKDFKCDKVCIKCQSCIKKCPVNARYFDDEDFLSHVSMLENNYVDNDLKNVYIY